MLVERCGWKARRPPALMQLRGGLEQQKERKGLKKNTLESGDVTLDISNH